MRKLITNIGILAGIDSERKSRLCGKDMSHFNTLANAWLLIEDGKFNAWGEMKDMPVGGIPVDEEIDARGGCVMSSWCDPHTHIVYAGSREGEFVDKIRGLSYAEIAKRVAEYSILPICSILSPRMNYIARLCSVLMRLCTKALGAWR